MERAAVTRLIVGSVLALVAWGHHTRAETILFVDDSAPTGGDGTSWRTPLPFLQDAFTLAGIPGSCVTEIRIAQGTYRPDANSVNPGGTNDEAATFALIDAVAVRGGYAGFGAADPNLRDIESFPTILSGDIGVANVFSDNSNHIVTSAGVSGVTIVDGIICDGGHNDDSVDPGGAGLYNVDGSPSVTNCIFTRNTTEADGGGAVRNERGSPVFSNCVFTLNAAIADLDGSAMLNNNSDVAMFNCIYVDNICDGAVQNSNATCALIVNCVFQDHELNCAGGGPSGIRNEQSNATIIDCAFLDNDDESSGAVENVDSVVLLQRCVFQGNTGDVSGALYNESSDATILECQFVNNFAGEFFGGGAITNNNSNIIVGHSHFLGNVAGNHDGGAMRNVKSTVLIEGCQMVGNVASSIPDGDGGAIASEDSFVTITNCSLAGNSDWSDDSSAIYASGGLTALTNCIVWHHIGQSLGGPGSIVVNYSNTEDAVGGVGNISADPMFVSVPDPGPDNFWGTADDNFGNLRLLPASPCIDAGDNTAVPPDEFDLDNDGDTTEPIPFDLAGFPRFVDDPKTIDTGNGSPPIVDMGAYEFTGMINPLDLTGDGVVDAADLAQLLADWGACPGCAADYTADGIVSAADLAELLANWG